jgi:hypothetical protein
MTVEVELALEGPFTPNGVTTDYPFTFKIAATTEVVVADQDGVSISSALYTVTLAEDGEGGTIAFAIAPTIVQYDAIYIIGNPNFKQQTELSNDNLSIAALNVALNRSAMRDLYLKGRSERGLIFPPGDTINPLLSPAADRVQTILAFDLTGQPYVQNIYTAIQDMATEIFDDGTWTANAGVIDVDDGVWS